jgi:hypothetical protein
MQGGIYDTAAGCFLSSRAAWFTFILIRPKFESGHGVKDCLHLSAKILRNRVLKTAGPASAIRCCYHLPEYEKSLNPPCLLNPATAYFLPAVGLIGSSMTMSPVYRGMASTCVRAYGAKRYIGQSGCGSSDCRFHLQPRHTVDSQTFVYFGVRGKMGHRDSRELTYDKVTMKSRCLLSRP